MRGSLSTASTVAPIAICATTTPTMMAMAAGFSLSVVLSQVFCGPQPQGRRHGRGEGVPYAGRGQVAPWRLAAVMMTLVICMRPFVGGQHPLSAHTNQDTRDRIACMQHCPSAVQVWSSRPNTAGARRCGATHLDRCQGVVRQRRQLLHGLIGGFGAVALGRDADAACAPGPSRRCVSYLRWREVV